METVLVWTMLFWNTDTGTRSDLNKLPIHSSILYLKTEQECWDNATAFLRSKPTAYVTCNKTMITQKQKAWKDRKDEVDRAQIKLEMDQFRLRHGLDKQ